MHLAISEAESLRCVANRPGHFYPPNLVASQLEALQDPAHEPGVLVLDGQMALGALATVAADWLKRSRQEHESIQLFVIDHV